MLDNILPLVGRTQPLFEGDSARRELAQFAPAPMLFALTPEHITGKTVHEA